MNGKRALVVGLGIAGMSAALGLLEAGWTPVIVERSESRRTGGYFITLFPEGKEAAAELGVLDAIHERTPRSSATWEVDRVGNRLRSTGLLDQVGKPAGVMRGDIEQGLWQSVEDRVEVRYSRAPSAIVEEGEQVRVTFEHLDTDDRSEELFDLVVGADGLRSTVRRLAFGPDRDYMRSMDSIICAFGLDAQVPHFDERDSVVIAEPGRALWIFPLEDRAPAGLFTYRTSDVDAQFVRPPAETIRQVFGDLERSDVVRHALEAVDSGSEYLFDSVHQVLMPEWHRGRVLVLGDSAWCMSLYSGMGATAGLRGGAVLGRMLKEHPDDLDQALAAWEHELRPFIKKHVTGARIKHQIFVPSNKSMRILRGILMLTLGRRLATQATRAAAATVPAA